MTSSHAEAKRTLELAEAHKLCEGLEGKNEKERTSKLRLELADHYTALYKAEDALTEARSASEMARLEWDLNRHTVRALSVSMAEVAA